MSRRMNVAVALFALSSLAAMPAFAAKGKHEHEMEGAEASEQDEHDNDRGMEGRECRHHEVAGSYTYLFPSTDVWGDGTTLHRYVYQLTLAGDGIATRIFTGGPDAVLSLGTPGPDIGSWRCRDDGKLVVVLIGDVYIPTQNTHGFPPKTDLLLTNYYRTSLLFSITGHNTITQVEARTRVYGPNDDPTNPTGGVLGAKSTGSFPFNRVVPSDADLVAP